MHHTLWMSGDISVAPAYFEVESFRHTLPGRCLFAPVKSRTALQCAQTPMVESLPGVDSIQWCTHSSVDGLVSVMLPRVSLRLGWWTSASQFKPWRCFRTASRGDSLDGRHEAPRSRVRSGLPAGRGRDAGSRHGWAHRHRAAQTSRRAAANVRAAVRAVHPMPRGRAGAGHPPPSARWRSRGRLPLKTDHVVYLARRHERHDDAGSPRASGSARAVEVGLVFFRRIEVQNDVHAVDVDAACRQVRGHEHRRCPARKRLEHPLPFVLVEPPWSASAVDAFARQLTSPGGPHRAGSARTSACVPARQRWKRRRRPSRPPSRR